MINELVTVRQVAQELHVSRQTVYAYFKRGWLKKVNIGKLARVTRDSLEKLKEGRQYDDR